MALATKCPHCHTVFRVALDQLKLRGGIVRCGACNEVFDGNAALIEPALPPAVSPAALAPPALDLELDLDEAADAPVSDEQAAEPEAPAPDDLPADTSATAADTVVDTGADAEPAPPVPEPVEDRREPELDMPSEHIVAVALDDLHHFDDAAPGREPGVAPAPQPADDDGGAAAADRVADDAAAADLLTAAPESALLAAGAGAGTDTEVEDGADEPDFVKRAHRRERSARFARLGMIAGIPLLAFLLLGQGVYALRNRLAIDYPAARPALQALCAPLGCAVELPRQIDALAIEQGELQALAPGTFGFTTVLRNQSRSVQAWPHIELVLNDSADKPLVRRVFAPRDYLARSTDAATGFGPRSEQAVKLYFELDRVKASGYHIAIFYP